MSAPKKSYPVGKPAERDDRGRALDAHGKPIPPQPVTCGGCGWKGDMLDLLGCDDENTLWCPLCGSSTWSFC